MNQADKKLKILIDRGEEITDNKIINAKLSIVSWNEACRYPIITEVFRKRRSVIKV